MARIVTVRLDGYKSLHREYHLGPATALIGPNGSGKSACLEALIYALSGDVPAGRQLDLVATYFPERGGTVTVFDGDGHWIRRGITVDHEKKKVSEVFETSDEHSQRDGDTAFRWQASETVLDLRKFTSLSPAKRREHVLRLCGSGDTGIAGVFPALEREYAREIFGSAGTAKLLDEPPRTDDGLTDLPQEVEEMREAWVRHLGLREILRSHLVEGSSITELCLKLGQVAKEGKLGARKAALDAKSAARELEAEAKGARAAAAEVARLRERSRKLQGELAEAKALKARQEEAARAEKAATARAGEATERYEAALAELELAGKVPAGPEPPDVPETSPEVEAAEKAVAEARAKKETAALELEAFYDAEERLIAARKFWEDAKAELAKHKQSAIGKVVAITEGIPVSAHKDVPKLKAAVAALSAEWSARLVELELSVEKRLTDAQDLGMKYKWDEDGERIPKAAGQAESTFLMRQDDLAEARKKFFASIEEGQWKKRAWFTLASGLRLAQDKETLTRQALGEAEAAQGLARKRTREIQLQWAGKKPVEALEAEVTSTCLEQEAAERAAGAAEGYDSALRRAHQNEVDEAAWKAAEKAMSRVREKLVGEATAPLMTTLAEVLHSAGRKETPYLELENDRGKPIFELGWTRGEERIALGALSAGEAAIFGAALSVAIALRSPGRRVLLAEADPLDVGNLHELFLALEPWAEQLDALCLATSTDLESLVIPRPGWTVLELGKEAPDTLKRVA